MQTLSYHNHEPKSVGLRTGDLPGAVIEAVHHTHQPILIEHSDAKQRMIIMSEEEFESM